MCRQESISGEQTATLSHQAEGNELTNDKLLNKRKNLKYIWENKYDKFSEKKHDVLHEYKSSTVQSRNAVSVVWLVTLWCKENFLDLRANNSANADL